MTELTQLLADHAASFPEEAVGEDVRASLAQNLADGLAAIIGGSRAPGVPDLATVLDRQSAAGRALRFATGRRYPAAIAAQLNATAGHALDYDDTLDEGGGMHAGALVHSAALAVAEELGGVSGRRYIAAVAVGLDVAVRLARAPTTDFGWHRTSAFGIFGVVAATGRLLGLDRIQLANAFGIAYSQASGNRQCVIDGALSKRLQAGFAARDGILAVQLAQAGLTGATQAFEGTDGFFTLYQRGAFVRERIVEGLGTELLGKRISLKPYPCGRNLHGLLDASFRARPLHAGRTIDRIDIHVDQRSLDRANPAWPTHVVEAQFNIGFVVALSTVAGRTALADFASPDALDPAVRALGERIRVHSHGGPIADDRILFHYADGSTHAEAAGGVRLGHPDNPVPAAATRAKLHDCNAFAGRPLSEGAVDLLADAAFSLDDLPSTAELARWLAA